MNKARRVELLRDLVKSSLSGFQNYEDGDITIEELFDWLEIDAQQLVKRIDRFREAMHKE